MEYHKAFPEFHGVKIITSTLHYFTLSMTIDQSFYNISLLVRDGEVSVVISK
jgi:hypothetical protein